MQLARLIDDYCVWHEVSGHSAKTIEWYRWILHTFTAWLQATGRSTRITEITVHDARAFLQAQAQRTSRTRGRGTPQPGTLSDRTLHGYARALRAFFR